MLTNNENHDTLPSNLIIEELRAATRTPYWYIQGCLPVPAANQSQLVTHVSPNTFDKQKVQLSLFHSAILLEQLAPGYERYSFSFQSPKCLSGFAVFDGSKLAKLREMKSPIEGYDDVLENNLLFYVSKLHLPRFFAKLETQWLSYKIHWPLVINDFRQKLGRPDLIVRSSTIHRNGWGIVLHAHVVVGREARNPDQDLIRRNCVGIVRKSTKVGRRELSFFNICKYLPLGFCRIHVYRKDHRVRRFSNFGLENDLICTIQVQRISRIRSADILGSTIETRGQYRIAWNRSWLEDSVALPEEPPNSSSDVRQAKSF